MFRTAALSTTFLSYAVLAGTSFAEAQTLETTTQRPLPNGHTRWNNSWDFPRADVPENDPAKRKRLAALLHMAHVHAAAHACGDIDIAHENINPLFANDGFGPPSPSELAFVGGRISDFKEWLKAHAGEEVCEWAFENYGPKGAMHPDLVRSKPPLVKGPVSTSGRAPIADGATPHKGQKLFADLLKRKGTSTKRIALTALMLAVLPATASAQAVTGDRLLVSCREFEKTVQWEGAMYRVQLGRATECNDYMKAVFDLFWSTENKGDKISLLKTCQPPGQRVGIPQVVGIFIAFAEANPNALHMNAALLATSALRKAFPCAQETAAWAIRGALRELPGAFEFCGDG